MSDLARKLARAKLFLEASECIESGQANAALRAAIKQIVNDDGITSDDEWTTLASVAADFADSEIPDQMSSRQISLGEAALEVLGHESLDRSVLTRALSMLSRDNAQLNRQVTELQALSGMLLARAREAEARIRDAMDKSRDYVKNKKVLDQEYSDIALEHHQVLEKAMREK